MPHVPDAPSIAQKEVEEFLHTRVVRRRLLPRAVLVGLFAGLVATAFRIGLHLLEDLRLSLQNALAPHPWAVFLAIATIGALGCLLALSIGRLEPDSAGSGIPQMKGALEGHLKMNWSRVLWTKFLGAMASLGSGMAMGREGPTVQIGGAIGHELAARTGGTPRETRALTAAGSGAGLAAAFNAPLAGVTFVLEELQRDFQPVVFVATLLCAAVATVVSRTASGQFPVFQIDATPTPPLRALPVFIVLGLLGGVVGVAFNKSLLRMQELLGSLRRRSLLLLAGLVGLALGGAALISPDLLGGGHVLSERSIAGEYLLPFALALFVVRFALIHLCYGTGVPGGIFAPLLSLGALLGLMTFRVAGFAGFDGGIAVASAGVAGMCALFAGVVRAPLTGVVLIVEMTGSYDLLLPLLVTAFCAYSVAESMRDLPIYEALLQKLAANRGLDVDDEERMLVEYEIREGSPLVGKKLRNAGLPPGVLVVLCTMNGQELLPRADTLLLAHMKIAVIANSEASSRLVSQLVREPAE